jgi:hypothetical protein
MNQIKNYSLLLRLDLIGTLYNEVLMFNKLINLISNSNLCPEAKAAIT